jgi:hypothetical protein
VHWLNQIPTGNPALALDLRSNGALQTGVQVPVRQMFSVAMVTDVPDSQRCAGNVQEM